MESSKSLSHVTLFHVTPARSLHRILCEGLQPRIGPRARRAGERVAGVYFFLTSDAAADAVSGWLGDCFGESTHLALLEVRVSAQAFQNSREIAGMAGYEVCLTTAIAPEQIAVKNTDF